MKEIEDVLRLQYTGINPKDVNPMVLAYLGDAIYELFIRSIVVKANRSKVRELHKLTVGFVKAESQAKALKLVQNMLTEEEMGIVRRGKNHKVSSIPKNIGVMEYKMATGFEALLGYLYLLNKGERLQELMEKSITTHMKERKV